MRRGGKLLLYLFTVTPSAQTWAYRESMLLLA